MAPDRRLMQLRALVDRLERLPASPRREWMLREARVRLVDVETGDEPRPMRTLHEASAEPSLDLPGHRHRGERAVKRPSAERPSAAPAAAAAQEPPPSAPEPAPPRTAGWEPTPSTLFTDEVLWLGDPPADPGSGSKGVAPWQRGLRG